MASQETEEPWAIDIPCVRYW